MKCSECRYWSLVKASSKDRDPGGECRRHAPTATLFWPGTDADNWCGEFELKPSLKPCKECGKPVGAGHWNLAAEQEGPDYGKTLRASEMSPVCGECFALMEKGEHPRQIKARVEADKPPFG